jgi:hypothetical protein
MKYKAYKTGNLAKMKERINKDAKKLDEDKQALINENARLLEREMLFQIQLRNFENENADMMGIIRKYKLTRFLKSPIHWQKELLGNKV